MNSRVLKKSAIYLIGNFSSKIFMAIIIPIYAFYVQSSDLGYFDYSQSLMSIIIPIAFFSVWEAILKFTIDDQYKKTEIVNSAIILSMSASLLIITGMLIISVFVDIEYFSLIVLMFVLYGMVQIWQYAARGLGDSKTYVVSGVAGTVVNFVAILIFVVWLRLGLHGLFLSYVLSQIFTIAVLEFKLKLLVNVRFKRDSVKLLKKMIVFSAPLTMNTISSWLFIGFARVLINNKLGSFENGLYAFANKFAIVISMVGSVITMAVIEEAIISKKEKKKTSSEGKNASDFYVALISVAAVAIPAIKIFYDFIAESEYYSSFIYVPFLLLYASLSTLASNIGAQFQALEITKYQFISTIIGSIFTVVISMAFLNSYGILAVVFSQVVGALVMVIARYIIVKKYMDYKMNTLRMILSTLIYIILSLICLKANILVAFVLVIFAGICALLLNYDIILSIFKRKNRVAEIEQNQEG